MNKKLFTITVAAITVAISLYNLSNTSISLSETTSEVTAFAKWVKAHNKSYSTPAEYMYRFTIFKKSLAKVRNHQQKNGVSYTIGLNRFSDLTYEEFLTKHTGYRFSDQPKEVKILEGKIKEKVDWVSKGVVNPVKDQQRCGACWAFAALASLESADAIAGYPLTQLSEQQLVDCSGAYGNLGCSGGLMRFAFRYLEDRGAIKASDYPYTAVEGECQYDPKKVVFLSSNYFNVPRFSEEQIMQAVNIGVVSVGIHASEDFMRYTGGIFDGDCSYALNHAIAIVGYGSEGDQKYWVARNSWGTGYGEDGYIRIVRNDPKGPGKCGINIDPSYVLV